MRAELIIGLLSFWTRLAAVVAVKTTLRVSGMLAGFVARRLGPRHATGAQSHGH